MKKLKPILLALLFSITLNSCFKEEKGKITQIDPEEAELMLKSEEVQLIDVRSYKQFAESHIDGALNIDMKGDSLDILLTKIDKTKPILIYCNQGNLSAKCGKILEDKGFKKIFDLDGGLSKWESSGKQIVLKTKA